MITRDEVKSFSPDGCMIRSHIGKMSNLRVAIDGVSLIDKSSIYLVSNNS